MKLVIDRSKWLRGEGPDRSALLRSTDGKMCCLGFYAKACGLTDGEIQDVPAPRGDRRKRPGDYGTVLVRGEECTPPAMSMPDWIREEYNFDCGEAMEINDSTADEGRLTEIFAEHGVQLEFV